MTTHKFKIVIDDPDDEIQSHEIWDAIITSFDGYGIIDYEITEETDSEQTEVLT